MGYRAILDHISPLTSSNALLHRLHHGHQIRKPIAPWPENDNPEPSL
jgi:hypothetical protein